MRESIRRAAEMRCGTGNACLNTLDEEAAAERETDEYIPADSSDCEDRRAEQPQNRMKHREANIQEQHRFG